MERTVLWCILFAIFLSLGAEPVVSSPQEDNPPTPAPAALYSYGKPDIQLLRDSVEHGDSLVKERVKQLYDNLKEQLKEGDSHLKERIVEGLAYVKEERKEGDERLKEELDEDVAWLKERLARGRRQMEEELAEGEEKMNEEITELKKAFEKLRDSVKQWTQSAAIEELKQRVSNVQAELSSTQHQLQTNQQQMGTTEKELHTTRQQMQTADEQIRSLKASAVENEETLQTTQQKMDSTQQELNTTLQHLHSALDQIRSLKASSAAGSTFVRWGRTTCPNNTSLVYSGVAGGTWYGHTGGASNYLCLVMEPDLDNAAPPSLHNWLYGAEYELVDGNHEQDVVCSVCRASQATTIMIPATRACPAGWSTQYKGYLMSEFWKHKGRTEYVCVDEASESRQGGHENKNGALFYHVVTQCGSLPCPPYVDSKIVTCVVCSV
ncbi:uncharacterized protein LOC143289981 [Babylonia areolata]|uniref:uncharacterized protein LOC143289981 n=1 Tax=Babylonia areolata TaxID=304850 RepID=UPI003FD4D9E6